MTRITPVIHMNHFLEQQGITLPFGTMYIRGSEILPPPMSQEEETKYIELLVSGSQEAKQKLTERNLRLVVYIAKRFSGSGNDIEDLISIGTIGLVKAIHTFDASKNIRLATYASRCIHNEILMFLRKTNRNMEVSFDELSNIKMDGKELSLYDMSGADDDMLMRLENDADKQLLLKVIEKLTEREQNIIIMRFGLNGVREHTQTGVADLMGVTQSYISKLEKNIISRLRREMTRYI